MFNIQHVLEVFFFLPSFRFMGQKRTENLMRLTLISVTKPPNMITSKPTLAEKILMNS